LKLGFAGTPDFAVPALEKLAERQRIAAVFTQPDRPAGRGQALHLSPVKRRALELGLTVHQPASFKTPDALDLLRAAQVDVLVVVAYGLILPAAALALPKSGCFNIHASLLPRWRGAAPIQRAILDGDAETGVTIMQMDAGLDTGPMLLQEAVPIGPETSGGGLTETLAALGGRLAIAALDRLARGELRPKPQPATGFTYAGKISRDEARLDWRLAAARLERQVRAFDPWPGAFFLAGAERIRVLAAKVESGSGAPPGMVLDDRLGIACGEGVLRPTRVQRAGRGALDVPALLRGFRVPPGTVLPCPATD